MNDLSKYEPNVPTYWQLKHEMASDTLRQVEKDFALHGEVISFSHLKLESYPELVSGLSKELEQKHFLESSKLASILYQIDMNESDLALQMKQIKPQYVYLFLADKILKRCFEKVYWRYKMRED